MGKRVSPTQDPPQKKPTVEYIQNMEIKTT